MTYFMTILLVLLTSSAAAVPLANRHFQTASIPCDGQNIEGRNNASVVLDYGQTVQVHRVEIYLDALGPNQSGRIDVSQDFFSLDGQFRFNSLFDPARISIKEYTPHTVQLPPAQAIAIEYTCSGEGSRVWTVEIWFTGG